MYSFDAHTHWAREESSVALLIATPQSLKKRSRLYVELWMVAPREVDATCYAGKCYSGSKYALRVWKYEILHSKTNGRSCNGLRNVVAIPFVINWISNMTAVPQDLLHRRKQCQQPTRSENLMSCKPTMR